MENFKKNSLLINPFVRIAGGKALGVGLIVFLVSIFIGYWGNLIFDGVVDVHFVVQLTPIRALVIPSFALVVFILTLYITGRLVSQSSIRFIDVAGTVTLARTP